MKDLVLKDPALKHLRARLEMCRSSAIKKPPSRLFARHRAFVVAPEDPVAVPGDDAISQVEQSVRNEREHSPREAPRRASFQVRENENYRLGLAQQLFVRLINIQHHVNGFEIPSGCGMPRQNSLRRFPLQRGKAKQSCRIAAQNELYHPVTQPADSVVEHNEVRLTNHRRMLSHKMLSTRARDHFTLRLATRRRVQGWSSNRLICATGCPFVVS